MKYYYNSEIGTVESDEVIRSDYYELFGQDYDTFDDYLEACMARNNGVLTPVSVELKRVKRELNEKLMLANKYGYDEYSEELAELLELLDYYGRYARAEQK